jgi:hypothetical protein
MMYFYTIRLHVYTIHFNSVGCKKNQLRIHGEPPNKFLHAKEEEDSRLPGPLCPTVRNAKGGSMRPPPACRGNV